MANKVGIPGRHSRDPSCQGAVGFIDWLGLSAFQMVATVDLERLAGRREFKRLNKLVLRDNVVRLLRLPGVVEVLEALALEDELFWSANGSISTHTG